MALLTQIRSAQFAARKLHNEVDTSLLTTLLSEASMPGKNAGGRDSTDEEVVAVIKKFIKNTDETINAIKTGDAGRVAMLLRSQREKEILESFLPKQMTEDELREVLAGEIALLDDKGPKSMGKLMGVLKQNFAGRYDGALASKLVKEMLVA